MCPFFDCKKGLFCRQRFQTPRLKIISFGGVSDRVMAVAMAWGNGRWGQESRIIILVSAISYIIYKLFIQGFRKKKKKLIFLRFTARCRFFGKVSRCRSFFESPTGTLHRARLGHGSLPCLGEHPIFDVHIDKDKTGGLFISKTVGFHLILAFENPRKYTTLGQKNPLK